MYNKESNEILVKIQRQSWLFWTWFTTCIFGMTFSVNIITSNGVSNILIVSTSTQVKNVVLELSPFIENCLLLYMTMERFRSCDNFFSLNYYHLCTCNGVWEYRSMHEMIELLLSSLVYFYWNRKSVRNSFTIKSSVCFKHRIMHAFLK